MESNSRVTDLLNHDKDPMKTIIAGGKLKSGSSKKPCQADEWGHVKHEGKISYFKLSLCYGVSFTFTNGTHTPQGSECSSVKSFRVDECRPSWIVAKDKRCRGCPVQGKGQPGEDKNKISRACPRGVLNKCLTSASR